MYKKWFVGIIVFVIVCLLGFASIIVIIDPYFHYHKPIDGVAYVLNRDNERFQNDGIVRYFDYDTIITGTSMTENFKTSECDELFDAKSIKVPFAGGTYKEVNDNLLRAFEANDGIKRVIRSIDNECMIVDKDAIMEGYILPEYMTNENPFDDISYVLNKEAMKYAIMALQHTLKGYEMTSFDDYATWMEEKYFGKYYVLITYTLEEPATEERVLSEDEIIMIKENVRQNIVDTANTYPETEFYLYFPTYSICYWDKLNNLGEISYWIEAERIAIEEMLQCPNIKIFSFSNKFDIVCNLDNYVDRVHHGDWINSQTLEWLSQDECRVTKENYLEYLEEKEEFYSSFDYSSLRGGN